MAENSYVNIACEATIDVNTRLLTVDVEAYFTGSGAPSTMNINIALTQDGIEGYQRTNGITFPGQYLTNGDYVHNNMLRHLVTGQ